MKKTLLIIAWLATVICGAWLGRLTDKGATEISLYIQVRGGTTFSFMAGRRNTGTVWVTNNPTNNTGIPLYAGEIKSIATASPIELWVNLDKAKDSVTILRY